MLMRLKDVPPDAILVQICTRDYCLRRSIHGPVGRLKLVWADDAFTSVRPQVACLDCDQPFVGTFAVEYVGAEAEASLDVEPTP